MKRLLMAFQFCTIIPLKDMGDVSEQEMGKSIIYFPLVGCAEGIMMAAAASLFIKIFPAEVTNALLVLLLLIINGGLHLDGLADTFDGIASRGDRDRKLSIMKDSTVGPAGVIAIVMVLLLKYVLLNAVFLHAVISVYYVSVTLMPIAARWGMVPAAFYGKSARNDGLGRIFIDHTGSRELLISTGLAVSLALFICGLASLYAFFAFYVMFALPVLFMVTFGAVRFFGNQFGGMTGDSFGALHEIGILLFLISTVIWLQKFI